jgi:hypothetical protein
MHIEATNNSFIVYTSFPKEWCRTSRLPNDSGVGLPFPLDLILFWTFFVFAMLTQETRRTVASWSAR